MHLDNVLSQHGRVLRRLQAGAVYLLPKCQFALSEVLSHGRLMKPSTEITLPSATLYMSEIRYSFPSGPGLLVIDLHPIFRAQRVMIFGLGDSPLAV